MNNALTHPIRNFMRIAVAVTLLLSTVSGKMSECGFDCEVDEDCDEGLLCAARHLVELQLLGLSSTADCDFLPPHFVACYSSFLTPSVESHQYLPYDYSAPNPIRTDQSTAPPTPIPTPVPTVPPTPLPTPEPTTVPTAKPSSRPTDRPTLSPTPVPTPGPSLSPTPAPTYVPTSAPSYEPQPACCSKDYKNCLYNSCDQNRGTCTMGCGSGVVWLDNGEQRDCRSIYDRGGDEPCCKGLQLIYGMCRPDPYCLPYNSPCKDSLQPCCFSLECGYNGRCI